MIFYPLEINNLAVTHFPIFNALKKLKKFNIL